MSLRSIARLVVVYLIVSVAVFAAMLVFWSGFPRFPNIVARSVTTSLNARLSAGGYDVLLYVTGRGRIPIKSRTVHQIYVSETAGERNVPIDLELSDYYFSRKDTGGWIEGHAMGHFELSRAAAISIKIGSVDPIYQGVLLRTGFRPFFTCVALYEGFVLVSTAGVFLLLRRAKS